MFIKFKWIYKYSRSYIVSIILIVALGSITSLLTIYRALTMKNLIDNSTPSHVNKMIYYLCVFGILIITGLIIDSLISLISSRSYNKMCLSIQKGIYCNVLGSRWQELSAFHSSDITTRITNDADGITNMVMVIIPSILSSAVLLIGSLITLFNFDHTLALIGFLLSPPIVLISKYYSKKLKALYLSIQQNESKLRSLLNESIQNIVIIKSFCLEKYNINNYKKLQKKKLNLVLSQTNLSIINNLTFSASSWLTFFLVFTWGAFNLSNGSATYGTISALLQLFSSIQSPFTTLASSVPKAVAALASAERLMEISVLTPDSNNNLKTDIPNFNIELENVSFNYQDNLPVITDLNLKIHSGETVAIVGPSGEGKTTLIRLLLSLIYPKEGHIYFTDSQNKFEIDASCRELISYVPQGNTLFSGTISENLKFGNMYATDEELKAVTAATSALEFIEQFTDGFNTVIGERGLGLSEGQAQRLAISRALLKKSPVLILDEATSALDIDTELKVLNTIKNLKHRPICLIITHRPSALAICSEVLKLQSGNLYDITNSIKQDLVR